MGEIEVGFNNNHNDSESATDTFQSFTLSTDKTRFLSLVFTSTIGKL